MSENQKHIVAELAKSYPKGRALDAECRRSVGPLVSQGLVTWLQAGGIRIYMLTKKGIDALPK